MYYEKKKDKQYYDYTMISKQKSNMRSWQLFAFFVNTRWTKSNSFLVWLRIGCKFVVIVNLTHLSEKIQLHRYAICSPAMCPDATVLQRPIPSVWNIRTLKAEIWHKNLQNIHQLDIGNLNLLGHSIYSLLWNRLQLASKIFNKFCYLCI